MLFPFTSCNLYKSVIGLKRASTSDKIIIPIVMKFIDCRIWKSKKICYKTFCNLDFGDLCIHYVLVGKIRLSVFEKWSDEIFIKNKMRNTNHVLHISILRMVHRLFHKNEKLWRTVITWKTETQTFCTNRKVLFGFFV